MIILGIPLPGDVTAFGIVIVVGLAALVAAAVLGRWQPPRTGLT